MMKNKIVFSLLSLLFGLNISAASINDHFPIINGIETDTSKKAADLSDYYLLTRSAVPSKEQAVYNNIGILYNNIDFNFAENFSLGLAIIPQFSLSRKSSNTIPFRINLAYNIQIPKSDFYLGAKTTILQIDSDFVYSYGLKMTYANESSSFTIGVEHINNFEKDWAYQFAAMTKISSKTHLFLESIGLTPISNSENPTFLGARRKYKKSCLDYGIVTLININKFTETNMKDGIFFLPMLSYKVSF